MTKKNMMLLAQYSEKFSAVDEKFLVPVKFYEPIINIKLAISSRTDSLKKSEKNEEIISKKDCKKTFYKKCGKAVTLPEIQKKAQANKSKANSIDLKEVYDAINHDIYIKKKELFNENDAEKSINLINDLSALLKEKLFLEQNAEKIKQTPVIFRRIVRERCEKKR